MTFGHFLAKSERIKMMIQARAFLLNKARLAEARRVPSNPTVLEVFQGDIPGLCSSELLGNNVPVLACIRSAANYRLPNSSTTCKVN